MIPEWWIAPGGKIFRVTADGLHRVDGTAASPEERALFASLPPAETAFHGSDYYRFAVTDGRVIVDVDCAQQIDYARACARHGVAPRLGTLEQFRDYKQRLVREYETNESLYIYSRSKERDVLATSDEGRAIIAERDMKR